MQLSLILTLILLVAVINHILALPQPMSRRMKGSSIVNIQKYLEIATTKNYAEVEKKRLRQTRNVLPKMYRWPKNIVPYYIWTRVGRGSFKIGGDSYNLIKKSMKDIEDVSCVRFQELKFEEIEKLPEENFLKIFSAEDSECRTVSPGYGLGSAIFLKDSENGNSDENHCMTSSSITHELLHVLGFLHEHQRHDRDNFIKIFEENIKEDKLNQFKIIQDFRGSINLGAPYDRLSLMHYSNKSFSKNKKNTIVWRKSDSIPLGGTVMSKMDKLKLNTYYECSNFPTLKPVPEHIEQCPQSVCSGKTDGFYPHPSNKHLYVKCKNNKATCRPCFPQNSVFVNRCGICMSSDTEPCKTEGNCPKDLCQGQSSNGLFAHVHKKNMYVNCYFGQNFGCYQCPDENEFDDVERRCIWRPNLNTN